MSSETKTPLPCPVCGIPVSAESIYRPFCSKRCQQIDLGRWAGGEYHIKGEPGTPWEMEDGED